MPKENDRRIVSEPDTRRTVSLGKPWPDLTYLPETTTEADSENRTILLIVSIILLASAAAVVPLYMGGRTADLIGALPLVVAAVVSVAGAAIAARSARTAARFNHSLILKLSERRQFRALEVESPILMRALEVFGDSERALEWMRESNPALKNEPPIRVMHTEAGRRDVLDILGRIQHGVIS